MKFPSKGNGVITTRIEADQRRAELTAETVSRIFKDWQILTDFEKIASGQNSRKSRKKSHGRKFSHFEFRFLKARFHDLFPDDQTSDCYRNCD